MAILWHMLICRLRGHNLVQVDHPNFHGMTFLRCKRCHEGVHLPGGPQL
jgi:hypothetical protein